jgi:hypothetical protein
MFQAALLGRFMQWSRINCVVQFWPLPLRAKHTLLSTARRRRADFIA